MKKLPCIDCPKRYPGCHDHCSDKKEWDSTVKVKRKEYEKKYLSGYKKTTCFNTHYAVGLDRESKRKGKRCRNFGE